MATGPQSEPELIEVFETPQESEAMVVHGLLESAGIESAVITGEAQDVLPGVGGMIIRVSADEADEARRIIEEYRNTSTGDDDDESNEGEDEPETV